MLQFTVPQFIDVEDKIIGPITTRQFLIMLVTFILIGICFKLLRFTPFVIVGVALFSIGGVIAFLKINGRPFHYFILNFLQTFGRPFLRIWNKVEEGAVSAEKETAHKTMNMVSVPKERSSSRLAELSLIVDTQGAFKGNTNNQPTKINSNV